MDFHLEKTLRLKTDPEHKNLYSWAINEIDDQGDVAGRDQIPWNWDHYFTGVSLVMDDSIEVKRTQREGEAVKTEVDQRQNIRVNLRPGDPRDGGDYWRQTTFRFFGTDRVISKFQLDIRPIRDPAEQESCSAWGSPSYSHDSDFVTETTDDTMMFYLFVRSDTFARYAAKITMAAADEIVLRVGSVQGFYSEWSPSISTREVKVLARGREQKIELPAGAEGFEPPRLGDVGEAELYINRKLAFDIPAGTSEDGDTSVGTVRLAPAFSSTTGATVPDPQLATLLRSIRTSARWIVGLLVVLILVLMTKQ
jgi:hypothetical protein